MFIIMHQSTNEKENDEKENDEKEDLRAPLIYRQLTQC